MALRGDQRGAACHGALYRGVNSLVITVFGEEEQPGDGCEHALELADQAAVATAFPAEHPPCLHLCHGMLNGGAQPYFVLQGNICALLAARDHVNVFLYDGGIVPDPDGIITGGQDNKTARTVAIRQGEAINAPALCAMFRQIIASNRAGGWRKLKRER